MSSEIILCVVFECDGRGFWTIICKWSLTEEATFQFNSFGVTFTLLVSFRPVLEPRWCFLMFFISNRHFTGFRNWVKFELHAFSFQRLSAPPLRPSNSTIGIHSCHVTLLLSTSTIRTPFISFWLSLFEFFAVTNPASELMDGKYVATNDDSNHSARSHASVEIQRVKVSYWTHNTNRCKRNSIIFVYSRNFNKKRIQDVVNGPNIKTELHKIKKIFTFLKKKKT